MSAMGPILLPDTSTRRCTAPRVGERARQGVMSATTLRSGYMSKTRRRAEIGIVAVNIIDCSMVFTRGWFVLWYLLFSLGQATRSTRVYSDVRREGCFSPHRCCLIQISPYVHYHRRVQSRPGSNLRANV